MGAIKKASPREVRTYGNATELRHDLPLITGDKVYQSYWSSPESLASYVEGLKESNAWNNAAWSKDENFYGTKTMEDAIKLARCGWAEGALKAERLQGKILATNPLQLKQIKYDIVGAYPNVPKAVAGNPLNMRVPDLKKASRRPVITLMSDIGGTCNHSKDEFINRAAVVAALVDQIESAGYCCEVVAFSRGHSGGYGEGPFDFFSSTVVKSSSQPLDIGRIAFGLGHTAMFRRLVFAEKCGEDYCKDLGRCLGTHKKLDMEGFSDKNTYLIPGVQGTDHFRTEASAETVGLKYIIDSLTDQGFPVFQNGVHTDTKEKVKEDF